MTNGKNEIKETWELWSIAKMKCKKLGWLKPFFLLATQSTKKEHI